MEVLDIAWLGDADGVGASHEGGAGDSADRLSVEVGELQSFGRHLVDARGLDRFGTKAAEVFVALVIGEDEDDVWLLGVLVL